MDKKSLVLTTLIASLLLFVVAVFLRPDLNAKPNFIGTITKNAKIDLILIEDFRCYNCRKFTEQVLPLLQQNYVKTGIANFKIVPVAFLQGSQAVANAVLEVYQLYPDKFYDFVHAVAKEKDANIFEIASVIGGIDITKLKNCIEKGLHDKQLDQNLKWAQKFMGPKFRTPALFANGKMLQGSSFATIDEQLKKILNPS